MNNNMNMGAGMEEPQDERKLTGFSAEIYEWLEAIAFALAIVVLIFTFIFRIVSISGESMLNTLQDDDRVLVWSIFYEPEQNDVIIILPSEETEENEGDLNKPLVKRIVATEGQWVDIRDGSVFVSDSEDGNYVLFDAASSSALDSSTDPGGYFNYPQQIAEDCVFVLGDNRNVSTDSRDSRVGMIHTDNILGKVIFRIYPFDSSFGSIE